MKAQDKYQNIIKKLQSIEETLGESSGDSCLKSELIDCRVICKNEILREELIDLGYQDINENTSIHSNLYTTIGYSVHQIRKLISWDTNCRISWPDSDDMALTPGKYYVLISFTTGAYNLCETDDEYDKAKPLFNDMWNEIMEYSPDASDSHNCYAWFEIHNPNAAKIWNDIQDIINKYKKKFKDEKQKDKEYQIKLLEKQIEQLKREQ